MLHESSLSFLNESGFEKKWGEVVFVNFVYVSTE